MKKQRHLITVCLACLLATSSLVADQDPKTARIIRDFGAAENLAVTFDRPVAYVTHPNGGVTVRYVEGLKLTTISTATKDRGGAMWNPNAGEQGYANWKPQGFDANMKSKYGKDTYSAQKNIAPEATGSPFAVPGEGSLIIAIPGNIPESRVKKVVERFRVVNFAEQLHEADSYRAPTRGMTTARANWTQAKVHANLDKIFPADIDMQARNNFTPDAGDNALRRFQESAAAGIFYTAWGCDEISPRSGAPWYGRDLTKLLGQGLLALRDKDRDQAYRYALADAIVQYAIDLYGTIVDGSYFQMNGGWTAGRIWIMEVAGVLLEDEQMLNMVADPLHKPTAPGLTLKVLPFTEQRQYSPVQPEGEYFTEGTRPEVSDQMAKWGSVVGADPEEVLGLTPEDVGIRYWTVQNDRSYGRRSQLNSWIKRSYHGVNISGQIWVRAAYALIEQTGHADRFANSKPARDGIDTSLQQWWQMEQNMQKIQQQGLIPNPHNFLSGGGGGLYSDWTKNSGKSIVDVNELHKSKPGRAYPTLLTDKGDGRIAVEFNGYMPGHGHPIQSHDIRWSIDGGETWNLMEDAADGLIIDTKAKGKTTVMVQDRLTTAAGTGAWSPTMRDKNARVYGEIIISP